MGSPRVGLGFLNLTAQPGNTGGGGGGGLVGGIVGALGALGGAITGMWGKGRKQADIVTHAYDGGIRQFLSTIVFWNNREQQPVPQVTAQNIGQWRAELDQARAWFMTNVANKITDSRVKPSVDIILNGTSLPDVSFAMAYKALADAEAYYRGARPPVAVPAPVAAPGVPGSFPVMSPTLPPIDPAGLPGVPQEHPIWAGGSPGGMTRRTTTTTTQGAPVAVQNPGGWSGALANIWGELQPVINRPQVMPVAPAAADYTPYLVGGAILVGLLLVSQKTSERGSRNGW